MFKKYFWRLFSVLMLLATIMAGIIVKPQSTFASLAGDIKNCYTYSYNWDFYKADKVTPLDTVNAGDTFYLRASGSVSCIAELPSLFKGLITKATIVVRVVAQQAGVEVVLNPEFKLEYTTVPDNVGESASAVVDVPLIFPGGSATGSYTIFGQITNFNLELGGLFTYDAKGLLSQEELNKEMGSVGYGITVPVVVSGGSGGSGGGSGGGAVGPAPPPEPEPITKLTSVTAEDGSLAKDVIAQTLDNLAVLDLPKGTKIIDFYGHVATGIVMEEVKKENEPNPPDGSILIGKAYNFGGNGLTFSQPVQLTFTFDPTSFPTGVQKKDLYIAWWDVDNKQWVALADCIVDETANAVTSMINHFTIFTVIAKPSLPTTTTTQTVIITPPVSTTTTETLSSPATPAPVSTTRTTAIPANNASTTPFPAQSRPADFIVSNVTDSTGEIEVGGNITVNAVVTNTGDAVGEQTIELKLNGSVVETKRVTLAGKSQQPLSFTLKAGTAGVQTITIGSQSLQLNVKEATQTTPLVNIKKIYGYMVGALIGIGAGLVVLLSVFILKKPWRKT